MVHNSKRPSLKDVARMAGTSTATASRAISGKGYVSAETRARILDTVQKLSYRSRPWNSTGRGAFPLGALLLPERGAPPSLRPASAMAVRARVVASLPFVAETMDRCPGLDAALDAIVRAPSRVLRFAPDPGWLPLLRGFAP